MRGTFMNQKLLTTILQKSNELITSESFLIEHRIGNSFTRSRKLSFKNLIYYILNSTHKSISINYSELVDIIGDSIPSLISKQAVSKARQGISHKAFIELFRLSVKQFYSNSSNLCTWNGFHVYAVDGSTIQVPESAENYNVFGGNPNKTEIISPLASASALYDILNDILVDVSLNPYRHNERESAKEHLQFLPDFPKSIIVFDRGYPSEDLFRFLNSQGILFLMRIPKNFKKAISKEPDFLFEYPASKDKDSLILRGINFRLNDETTEYLVTNMMPDQMPAEKFPELYRLRWGIECKYRELKNRLEIESFNSIKSVCVQQEFFAAMYISNLASILKRDSDAMIVTASNNKHNYQSSRSYILNRIKKNIIFLLKSSFDICNKRIIQITNESSKILSVIRPDRKFGRYRKHTRRRYYNHMKSCI